jgi:hypothetical protein
MLPAGYPPLPLLVNTILGVWCFCLYYLPQVNPEGQVVPLEF